MGRLYSLQIVFYKQYVFAENKSIQYSLDSLTRQSFTQERCFGV